METVLNTPKVSFEDFYEVPNLKFDIQKLRADLDKILEEKKKARMLLQIHDELIFECLKKDESEVKKIVKAAMASVSSSDHHMFSIPLALILSAFATKPGR